MRPFSQTFLALAACFLLVSGAQRAPKAASQDAQVDDTAVLAVAYQPRGFSPGLESADTILAQIREDLRLLRSTGFRSLVTYGAAGHLGKVPMIAREEGIDGTIILGVWDPLSEAVLGNAIAQAEFVDGYCVGNEGLGIRYSRDELAVAMESLRVATGRPVRGPMRGTDPNNGR